MVVSFTDAFISSRIVQLFMHIVHENAIIVGTSHVSSESVAEIRDLFDHHEFALVGIELDRDRLERLMSPGGERPSFLAVARQFGARSALFYLFASWVQQKVGRVVGLDPGSDMKSAVLEARKHKVPVACIDQHINTTLRKLNREFTFGFFGKVVIDFFRGLLFPKRMQKKYGLTGINLQKVPSVKTISVVLGIMKKEYPGFYRALVEDRNKVMARNIVKLQRDFADKKILIVIGAGHLEGIKEILGSHQFEIINYQPIHDIDATYSTTIM